MHQSPDRLQSNHQPADEAKRPSTKPVPQIGRNLSRPFGRRHPKGVAAIRYLVAVWLVCLGSVFCALEQYWGALFFPAAGAIGALAYLMPGWNLALEAEGDV
jgi:hypothetical protein